MEMDCERGSGTRFVALSKATGIAATVLSGISKRIWEYQQ